METFQIHFIFQFLILILLFGKISPKKKTRYDRIKHIPNQMSFQNYKSHDFPEKPFVKKIFFVNIS
jgi:hypothetical protein